MKPRGSPREKFQTLVDALHGLGFVTERTPGVPNVIRIPLGLEGESRGHVEFLIYHEPRASMSQMVVLVDDVHLMLHGGDI